MSEGTRLFRLLLAWLLAVGNLSCLPVSSTGSGNRPKGIVSRQFIAEGVQGFSLSPNGEQVILLTHQSLKKLSLKTQEQSPILPLTDIAPFFSWSLNGRWFAFKRIDLKSQTQEICLIDLQDNRLYHLVRAQRIFGFALSPEGNRLAWIEEEGKMRKNPAGYFLYEGKVKRSLIVGSLKGGKVVNSKSSLL